MVLAMSRPWLDPDSGIWYLRKRVPKDLQALVGREVYKVSRGTKDPNVAKQRHAKALADLEVRWANLRAGPSTLSEREAHTLAASVNEDWLARYSENPSEPTGWRTDLYSELWAKTAPWDMDRPIEQRFRDLAASLVSPARSQEEWCIRLADESLAHLGRRVDEAGRIRLARAVANAIQRASLTLERAAHGDYPVQLSHNENVGSDAPTILPSPAPSTAVTLSVATPTNLALTGLFEGWWKEAQVAGRKTSTHESYSHTIKNLIAFLSHDDATRVTGDGVDPICGPPPMQVLGL
ncbi:DUF6538 domain-containing protein [Methylobacterium planeticum]|uniref:DUF6538 domain-containing protein n=1 Tax=Methylobacterium planeticum TaxID=2615211 RepID=A0A6N6MGW9_9HYPH|nr:DUF6538 domain-containing protein [Methylobacterium planeticum]KAB1068190.1 hypothetical protein F6X51_27155 [Methylobacterium planeticum]